MKKIFTLLIGIILSLTVLNAQDAPPQAFSFKATIKDNKANEVVLKTISLRISILQSALNGTAVYIETFRPTTNLYSQVDVEIGHGDVIYGIFSSINWADDAYFLKVEVDVKGGTNYQVMSVSQLLSVPYALYSGAAANSFSGYYSDLIGAPNLSQVATSGNYNDLFNLPLLFSGDFNALSNKPNLFSGYYDDLLNKPTLFDGTWGSLSGKPDLADIALSGSWEDLINKPTTLSGYGITDAMSTVHPANSVNETNILNWNTAFGWGPHVGQYKPIDYVPTWSDITDNPFLLTSPEANQLLRFNSVSVKWENWLPDFLTEEIDGSVSNEIQNLILYGRDLTISGEGGNKVTFTLWDVDLTNDVTLDDPQTIRGYKSFTGINTFSGEVYFKSKVEVPTPTYPSDATPKAYVDALEARILALESAVNALISSTSDEDDDGYTIAEGDCNDNDAAIHPGATEVCWDGIDQDCDGEVDENCSSTYFTGVAHYLDFSLMSGNTCLFPMSELSPTTYAAISPELYNQANLCGSCIEVTGPEGTAIFKIVDRNGSCGIDFNCSIGDLDLAYEGFDLIGNPTQGEIPISWRIVSCDVNTQDVDDDGYTVAEGDCNDNDASIYPGATEICGDGIDQDCDGEVDEDCQNLTEVCDGIDNDGDGQIDEGCFGQCYRDIPTGKWRSNNCLYDSEGCTGSMTCAEEDLDDDGYTSTTDCNDFDNQIHPGAIEICGDGIDQDCDGSDLVCPVDTDNDGIPDATDNCPGVANPDQADTDGDGTGDACDISVSGKPLIDIDGNTYKTVKIGDQLWMAENLKTTKYNDGIQIANVTDDTEWYTTTNGAFCYYENNPINAATYGALYNRYAVSSDKLCPIGWRLPYEAEYNILPEILGCGTNEVGGYLKEIGTTHWVAPNATIEDKGFQALPGGLRNGEILQGIFGGLGYKGYWYSEYLDGTTDSYKIFSMQNSSTDLTNLTGSANNGFSVRCVAGSDDVDDDDYTVADGDCNDNDASIYPGATEICGDGIDQDCDGNDLACGYSTDCFPASSDPIPTMVRLINEKRTQRALSPVAPDPRLILAAQKHAEYLFELGTISHIGENESTFSVRCSDEGYTPAIGELVAMGFSDPTLTFNAWFIDSIPTVNHHDIILLQNAKHLGVGYAGGFWVVDFGSSTDGPTCVVDNDNDNDGYTLIEGDCNNNDASIYPGATEICGDGIDQDCDGSDLACAPSLDNDNDGYTVAEGDCNDNDDSIHPGATEIEGDGIDQNCDGSDLNSPWLTGILERHNYYRMEYGLNPVKWSDQLAQESQIWANYLASKDSLGHSTPVNYGENLLYTIGTTEPSPTVIVDYWAIEKQYLNLLDCTCLSGTCGHYLTIISYNVSNIGCGKSLSTSGKWYYVCRYSPGPNMECPPQD